MSSRDDNRRDAVPIDIANADCGVHSAIASYTCALAAGVDATRGFIQQQHVGIMKEQAPERDLLLTAPSSEACHHLARSTSTCRDDQSASAQSEQHTPMRGQFGSEPVGLAE